MTSADMRFSFIRRLRRRHPKLCGYLPIGLLATTLYFLISVWGQGKDIKKEPDMTLKTKELHSNDKYSASTSQEESLIREKDHTKAPFCKSTFICDVQLSRKLEIDSIDHVDLYVVGDWGGSDNYPYSTSTQRAVAAALTTTAKKHQPAAVLTPGDVMYETGVGSVNSERFNMTFEKVYASPYLNVPWYIVAGNHDHSDSVLALIKHTERSNKWTFPAQNYKVLIQVSKGKGHGFDITILMLDTTLLCGNLGEGPRDKKKANTVWDWIQDMLQHDKSDYLFIVGHHPTFSIGLHGPTPCISKKIHQFHKNVGITAYISGHDHNLQHYINMEEVAPNNELHHFVVGAGSKSCKKKTHASSVPEGILKYFYSPQKGGFGIIKLSKENARFTFLDSNGTHLYHTKLPRRRHF